MPTGCAGRPLVRPAVRRHAGAGAHGLNRHRCWGGCMLLCLHQVFGANTPSHLSFKGSIVGIQEYSMVDINTYPDHPSYQMHG